MKQEISIKLKRLYELYEQPMYRVAYAVLHQAEAAEDAVSDAFLKVVRHINKIGDPESEEAKHYMIKVIRSTAFTQYRKLQKKYEAEILIEDSSADIPVYDRNDIQISDLLDHLEIPDRELVKMRCCDELPWQTIADKMNITAACARKRFERVRKQLIKLKGEQDCEQVSR